MKGTQWTWDRRHAGWILAPAPPVPGSLPPNAPPCLALRGPRGHGPGLGAGDCLKSNKNTGPRVCLTARGQSVPAVSYHLLESRLGRVTSDLKERGQDKEEDKSQQETAKPGTKGSSLPGAPPVRTRLALSAADTQTLSGGRPVHWRMAGSTLGLHPPGETVAPLTLVPQPSMTPGTAQCPLGIAE